MYRRWQLWLPALALATLVLTTSPAAAQRFGRGGGRGYAPGYGQGNAWNGYYGPGSYGNGWGNGYGNNWYGRGYYGNGYYGNNWNGRGYYGNGYYDNTYADYEPNYYYGQTPQYQQGGYSSFYPSEEMPQNAAMVHVQVPRDAELWFGGDKTSQTGPARDFVTPELKQDKAYFYTLKARWTDDNGKAVERTKRVQVRPGAHIMVDFNRSSPTTDTPDRGENPEKRTLQPATDEVKPPTDRTPARPIPDTPRNKEAVP